MFSKGRGGFAHVSFESKQDAIKTFTEHNGSPMVIGDREVRMDYAFPVSNKGAPPPRRAVKDRHEPGPTIFVGGIPYDATRKDIREALEPLGKVVNVRIGALPYRTGQSNHILNLGFI
jgi:RNA recognition motif-containing protein